METTTKKEIPTFTDTTDKQQSNSELIERSEIKDSPFQVIGIEGEYFGVMGKYRITESAETKEEIEKELERMTWNRVVQVILILNEVNK